MAFTDMNDVEHELGEEKPPEWKWEPKFFNHCRCFGWDYGSGVALYCWVGII